MAKCPKCKSPLEKFLLFCPCGENLGSYFGIAEGQRKILAEIPYEVLLPYLDLDKLRHRIFYEGQSYTIRIRNSHRIFKQPVCMGCGDKIIKWLLLMRPCGGALRVLPCGENYSPFTVDHIIPKSRNGGNEYSNLQTMCYCCNNKKGNKIINS